MNPENSELRAVRLRIIQLLEADQYFILDQDEVEAKATLARYRKCNSQCAIVEFVTELLESNYPMESVVLKNPAYAPGTGYVMKKPYGWDIYIKLRITDSFTRPEVHIMSFHPPGQH